MTKGRVLQKFLPKLIRKVSEEAIREGQYTVKVKHKD